MKTYGGGKVEGGFQSLKHDSNGTRNGRYTRTYRQFCIYTCVECYYSKTANNIRPQWNKNLKCKRVKMLNGAVSKLVG